MKVVHNRYIPFGRNFLAVNIFGVIFSKAKLSRVNLNHEYIHTLQQREMLFVFFYLWYVLEYLVRLLQCRSFMKAYYLISFEREAYMNQKNLAYKQIRRHYDWIHYL